VHHGVEVGCGNPLDYDTWAQFGNCGWSYESVLPCFKKSEH
jgi:choline dehydrogenase